MAEVPALVAQAADLCRPVDRDKAVQRLTALGMTMAPNRPAAEASIWVHEMARLLGDLAEDVLGEAIDDCQRRLKFLPTVAEIREVAEPIMERRRREASRLDAMARYLRSGQPIPKALPPPPKPVMDRRGEPMTPAETEELNAILEKLGAVTRYCPDGSRYEVERQKKQRHLGPPRKPTRLDYIDMGVDPAILDQMSENKAQSHNTDEPGSG